MIKEVDSSLVKLYDHTYVSRFLPLVHAYTHTPHEPTHPTQTACTQPTQCNRHTESAQPRPALLAQLSFLRFVSPPEREALFGADSQLCKDVFVRYDF